MNQCVPLRFITLATFIAVFHSACAPQASDDASALNQAVSGAPLWATNVGFTFVGPKAIGTFQLYSNGVPEGGSSTWFERASDSAGSNAVNIGSGTTHAFSNDDKLKYLRFCITPASVAFGIYGETVCGSWTAIGRFFAIYTLSGYSGQSAWFPYEQEGGNGTCFKLSNYTGWNNVTESLLLQPATSPSKTGVIAYNSDNCDGGTAKYTTVYSFKDWGGIASFNSYTGTTNYAISSVAIVWSDTVSASNPTISITDNVATSSYVYSDALGLGDESSVNWYRADTSDGSNVVSAGSGPTYTFVVADSKKYLRFCVTPSNGVISGSAVCSSWVYVGPTLQFFDGTNLSGNSLAFPYSWSPSSKCINLTDHAWNDLLSSYVLYAMPSYETTVHFYFDTGCSLEDTRINGITPAGAILSNLDVTSICSYCNNQISSFRVSWNATVTANSVALTINGNTAAGYYNYYDSDGLGESGTTLAIQRANDASGSGAVTVGSSLNWTLTAADENKYLRLCVTASNGLRTDSVKCSSWATVGPLLKLYEDGNYGGSSRFFAYKQSANGTCFNLTGSVAFNDLLSSLKMPGNTTGNGQTIWLYTDWNCGGNSGTFSAPGANIDYNLPSAGVWNDSISSFKITWDTNSGPGYYKLQAQNSGQCMDVSYNQTANMTPINQYTCNGSTAQQYAITPSGDGSYYLIGRNSGKCVDVRDASSADGAVIQIYDCNGTVAQKFSLIASSANFFYLQNASNSKCIAVPSFSTTPGAGLIQFTCNWDTNQRWAMIGY